MGVGEERLNGYKGWGEGEYWNTDIYILKAEIDNATNTVSAVFDIFSAVYMALLALLMFSVVQEFKFRHNQNIHSLWHAA